MATFLDFAKFTFTAEQIRAVNELIWDDIVRSPELNMLHTVYPGIVFDKEIGFIGEGGLIGVASQGCNPTAQKWNVSTRKVVWQPRAWEVRLEECYKDLESTAAVYSLNTGVRVADFTDTDYMAIIALALTESMKKFIWRLFWFSDTAADNFSNGGFITDGTDVKYFNILNGFWKQFELLITANPSQHVTIAENAGATYAAQALDPSKVQGYLQKMVFGAPLLMQGYEGATIPCTQSFYNAYSLSLQGDKIESMYANLVNGQKTLTYNGIPLIPIKIWDEMIFKYQNNGTKLINPHRAIYITKDILAVGVDSEESFDDFDVWYEKKPREVIVDAQGKADAKLLRDDMCTIAM